MSVQQVPSLKIDDFEGPLALLFHLIEKNDVDIYDIPIAKITDQYMTYLKDMKNLDMEVTSDFLVMAATLIHIKSRMLLPGKNMKSEEMEEDPREELVVRLLQYRRCRVVAGELKERYSLYSPAFVRLPESPKSLGIKLPPPIQLLQESAFQDAVSSVSNRNQIRFADISSKIMHILKRDKISVKDKIKLLWSKLLSKKNVFFHEVFATKDSTRLDRITGFLAVLELLRNDKIDAKQKRPFEDILLIKKNKEKDDNMLFLDEVKEEALYD